MGFLAFALFVVVGCYDSELLRQMISGALKEIREDNWQYLVDKYVEGMAMPTDSCDDYPLGGDVHYSEIPSQFKIGTVLYSYYIYDVYGTGPEDYRGFTVDILDEVMERLNAKYNPHPPYTYVLTDDGTPPPSWTEGWFEWIGNKLNTDQIDVVDGVTILESRSYRVGFTCGFASETNSLLRSPSVTKSTPSEINVESTTLLVVNGYASEDEMKILFPSADIIEVNPEVVTEEEMVGMVYNGTAEFMAYETSGFLRMNLSSLCDGCDLLDIPTMFPTYPFETNVAFAVKKPDIVMDEDRAARMDVILISFVSFLFFVFFVVW